MIFNSFLFWAFNVKILIRGKFLEGQHLVSSKIQCVRVIIAKWRWPVLLDTIFCTWRLHKKLLNSPEKHMSRNHFLPIRFPTVKTQLFFPHHRNRSSYNSCCLQFPSISYVIREKYGLITPSSKLDINLTQSLVQSTKKVSLIFTDATSGAPFRRKNKLKKV